jgi:hypothetical protein
MGRSRRDAMDAAARGAYDHRGDAFVFSGWASSNRSGTTMEVPREIALTAVGVAVLLAGGFALYASRKQKQLRPLINRKFAEEFTARTGYEYPHDIHILDLQRTIAIRKPDGSVLLWGINRSPDTVRVFPATSHGLTRPERQ